MQNYMSLEFSDLLHSVHLVVNTHACVYVRLQTAHQTAGGTLNNVETIAKSE